MGVVAGLVAAGRPGLVLPGLGGAGGAWWPGEGGPRSPSLTLVTGSWKATVLVGAGDVDCEAGDDAWGGVTELVMMVGHGSCISARSPDDTIRDLDQDWRGSFSYDYTSWYSERGNNSFFSFPNFLNLFFL